VWFNKSCLSSLHFLGNWRSCASALWLASGMDAIEHSNRMCVRTYHVIGLMTSRTQQRQLEAALRELKAARQRIEELEKKPAAQHKPSR